MNKKIIISIVFFVSIFTFLLFYFFEKKENQNYVVNSLKTESQAQIDKTNKIIPKNQMILFYGQGCPHCKLVIEYIASNNIESKIPIIQKEVYYNNENLKELEEKAKTCGLPLFSIGVPFLWTGEKCIIGDVAIINFLKQKVK